jgi:hypothetical protein
MRKIGAEHKSIRKDIGSTDLELIFSVIIARDSVHIDEIIPIPITVGVLPSLRPGKTPIHLPVAGETLPEG